MEKNIYEDAIEKWGKNAQLDQMIEEMAELTVAINKYKRLNMGEDYLKNEKVMNNLYVELADVRLMLEQMEYMFGKENIDSAYEKQMQKFIGELYNK